MNTNTELELRPLEPHELDIVSGAGIPVQNQYQVYSVPFVVLPFYESQILMNSLYAPIASRLAVPSGLPGVHVGHF
jgi:hypothetical protein